MKTIKNKIKVLVVDDSLVFREALSKGLASDPVIEVVATASDPYRARDRILEFEPDVMTLDVEMPRMNGIEFLKRLMPQYPIPVVVVSAVSGIVFEALQAGAVDFVAKADFKSGRGIDSLIRELITKVKIASTANISQQGQTERMSLAVGKIKGPRKECIIAIGASTGGTEAVGSIVKTFSKDIPGTVVVQHMPPVFTKMYADRLNSSCAVEVKEAKAGDRVIPGRVLIAPGDFHMRIRRVNSEFVIDCFQGEKVNGHCPSVDVLFNSVAEQVGNNAIGIILTGMGDDGARGLLAMRRKGAKTIGQDEQSSVVYGMPKVAFEIGAVQEQAELNYIPQKIYSLIGRR